MATNDFCPLSSLLIKEKFDLLLLILERYLIGV